MARGRAKLTEKEERIMIQAQLTGLTTANMIKIANRMKALEKEKEDMEEISKTISGFAWEELKDDTLKNNKAGWSVTDKDGKNYQFVFSKKDRSWHTFTTYWNIKISKPGTRFKTREVKNATVYMQEDVPNRLCPNNSRELYSIIRAIKRGSYEHV